MQTDAMWGRPFLFRYGPCDSFSSLPRPEASDGALPGIVVPAIQKPLLPVLYHAGAGKTSSRDIHPFEQESEGGNLGELSAETQGKQSHRQQVFYEKPLFFNCFV